MSCCPRLDQVDLTSSLLLALVDAPINNIFTDIIQYSMKQPRCILMKRASQNISVYSVSGIRRPPIRVRARNICCVTWPYMVIIWQSGFHLGELDPKFSQMKDTHIHFDAFVSEVLSYRCFMNASRIVEFVLWRRWSCW